MVYDLSPASLGNATYDLVLVGDVIWHTISPLAALCAAASVCAGTLVLAQSMPKVYGEAPAIAYTGGSELFGDQLHWFAPTSACFQQLLLKLGFDHVVEYGTHQLELRPTGHAVEQTVIHATRKR